MAKLVNFDQRLESVSGQIWGIIAKIDELKGQWIAGVKLNPQTLDRLKRSVLVTSAGASTRIEGARLTDENVENLMRGLDITKFADRDKQEVKGYFELLEKIFNSYGTLKLTESAIKHFHKELLKYVSKDERHRGEYKLLENKVEMFDKNGKSRGTIFDTTPPYLVSKEMQELVEWTNQSLANHKYHPLLIVANFIVEFLKIHPFQDGNGRLSRIITNLLMLQCGYLYMPFVSHEKLVEDNKPAYYLSLRQSQKTLKTKKPNLDAWLNFFLTMILKQSQFAVELLSKENIENILSPKQLAVWQYMQAVYEATPGEIAERLMIARPTVNQALVRLLKLKRIKQIGKGRGTRYIKA